MRYALFSLFVLAFLVTACGGEPSATNTDTTTDTTTGSTAAGSGASAPSGASAEKDFEKALGNFMTGKFSVDYDITMTAEGETMTMTTSQYFDGTKRMRTDATAEGMESRTYVIDDAITTCFRQSGEWSCMQLTDGRSSSDSSPDGFSDLTNYAESDDEVEWTITKDGTMRIVGVTADCFRISQPDSSARYCIYDGVPLYMSATDAEGGYEMKATRYQKGVSNSDFAFPAVPSEGFGAFGMGDFGGDFNPEDFDWGSMGSDDWGSYDDYDPSMYE